MNKIPFYCNKSNIAIKAFGNLIPEHRRMRTWTKPRRRATKYLNLKHPEERKHEEGSDAGGRGNYNERFLMDPLRSIPAILAMRRVPTLCSNGTIKINCSSCRAQPSFWKYPLFSSCFSRIFFVLLSGFLPFVRNLPFPVGIAFKNVRDINFQSCTNRWTRKKENIYQTLLRLQYNSQYLKNMYIKINNCSLISRHLICHKFSATV